MQNLKKHPDAASPIAKSSLTLSEEDQEQTAQYIADMVLELRNIARAHGLSRLQSPLETSYYVAFAAVTDNKVPEGEQNHLNELSKDSSGQ